MVTTCAAPARLLLRSIGFGSNRLLLRGIGFELPFAAALIYLPPLQALFGMASLGPAELAILAVFLVVAWGSDELRTWFLRSQGRGNY
jgi:hypothetical protein